MNIKKLMGASNLKSYKSRVSDSRKIKDSHKRIMDVGTMYPEEYYTELRIIIESLEREGYKIGYYTDKDIEGFANEYNHPSLRDLKAEGDDWLANAFNEYLDEHQGEYGAEPEPETDTIYEVRHMNGWDFDDSEYEDTFYDEEEALAFAQKLAKENLEEKYSVYEVTQYLTEDYEPYDSEYHEIDSFVEYGD